MPKLNPALVNDLQLALDQLVLILLREGFDADDVREYILDEGDRVVGEIESGDLAL